MSVSAGEDHYLPKVKSAYTNLDSYKRDGTFGSDMSVGRVDTFDQGGGDGGE